MKLVDKLTHARLVELLYSNSSTGIFTWKKKSHPKSKVRPGDKAGCVGISRNGGIPYKYVGEFARVS